MMASVSDKHSIRLCVANEWVLSKFSKVSSPLSKGLFL